MKSEVTSWDCHCCGRKFYEDEVVGQDSVPVIPEDIFNGRLSEHPSDELHKAIFCPECRKLSHYERSKLFLLNKTASRNPHGYWSEMAHIQKALESIAEQSLKNMEIKIYIDGEDITTKVLDKGEKNDNKS